MLVGNAEKQKMCYWVKSELAISDAFNIYILITIT